jgi:hypothetical protein
MAVPAVTDPVATMVEPL